MLTKYHQGGKVHEMNMRSYIVGNTAMIFLNEYPPMIVIGEHTMIYIQNGNIQGWLTKILPPTTDTDDIILYLDKSTIYWNENHDNQIIIDEEED